MQEQDSNKLHDTAALRALTDQEVAEYVPDQGEVHEAEVVDLDSHEGTSVNLAEITAAKRATQAKFSNQRTQTHSVQFRKIAIPALFGVGIILWVIGGLTIWMKNNAQPEMVERNPLLANADLFMWLCILMGLALVGGAIVFLIELKKTQQ